MASLRTKRVTKRFDQLAKRILRAVYARAGLVESQREVAADAQQIDTWFKLDPALSGELRRIGLLGRMIDGPSTLCEAFHEAPGVDDYRDGVRKQLVADHLDVLEARRQKRRRPRFPRLWLLTAGRPEKVIQGYVNSMKLFEQWERQVAQKGLEQGVKKGLEKGVKKGLEQGVKKALVELYRARFGALPSPIKAALESVHDTETLDRWVGLFALKSAKEIAAVLAPSATRGS